MTTYIYSLSAGLSLLTFLGFALDFKSPESFHAHVYHSFPSFMRFFHEPENKNILSSSPLKSHNHKSSITAPICPLKFSLIPHRRGISKQEVQAPFLPISQEIWKELAFLPNISFPFFLQILSKKFIQWKLGLLIPWRLKHLQFLFNFFELFLNCKEESWEGTGHAVVVSVVSFTHNSSVSSFRNSSITFFCSLKIKK